MDKVTFIVDDETGRLTWMAPRHAPDLTDEQARTLAISQLSGAVTLLADAINRYCDQADDRSAAS